MNTWRPEHETEARSTRNAWLTTAMSAILVAGLLLYLAHGRIISLLGVAGLFSVAGAVTAGIHGIRRARDVRITVTTGKPLPTAVRPIVLVTVLCTATAVLALIAVLTTV